MQSHKKITHHAEGFVEEFDAAWERLAGVLTLAALIIAYDSLIKWKGVTLNNAYCC